MTTEHSKRRVSRGRSIVRAEAGVTLTELVVVATVIIIFAASSLPFLGSLIPDFKTRGGAEQVVEALRTARQNAIATTATYRVIINATTIQIICTDGTPVGNECPANRPPDSTEIGGRGRDHGGHSRRDAVRCEGHDHDRLRVRDHHLPERPALAGGSDRSGPGPRVPERGGVPMTMRRDAGLSMVELMVALMLLGIALMGLAAAFGPGRMAIQQGDQATTATFLARRVLEDMRNRAYDLDTDELVNGATFPAATGYGGITGFPSYRRTITFANDTPEAGTKTATVVIFYRNSSGVEQSVTLSTIFTQAS